VNKRFGFLSEPEDGEKLNIGLLKELTGSEEIVSRGLYEGSYTFVMETKLFLACNELPDINKGEDKAIWRRIRVVNFPSRFVDEPQEGNNNEYMIDRSLPARMREDISWRQTFVNILLEYHFRFVPEPDAIKLSTNEYREESDEISLWVRENIKYQKGAILFTKDVNDRYYPRDPGTKVKSKLKSNLEKAFEIFRKDNMFFTPSCCSKLRGWNDLVLVPLSST
jgi:putative DNA primase/helicase